MIEVVIKNSKPENIIPLPVLRSIREKEKNDEDCQKFLKWLDNSKTGQKYCYYIGDHITGVLVGRTAFNAYEEGNVLLYQKREGTKFHYWAEKRSRWH